MQRSSEDKITFHKYGSVFMLILAAVLVSFLFGDLAQPRMDFYNELWGPAYLLVHGQSPYDTSSLSPILPAAWFPMAIGFFSPLGLLPEGFALRVWYIFNILEVCLIIYLVQGKSRNLYNTSALVLMCFFFPLIINHITLGQLSITVTLCWILAIDFFEQDRRWLQALCIALALSKPHLGALAILGWSFWDCRHGGFRVMFASWGRILAMCLALCVPLFVAYPNWIPDAVISMGQNPPWSYPSLYILFERFFGVWGHFLWAFTSLIVIGMNFWLWKMLPLKKAVYWSLALAPLVTPYVGGWDFVVLFPLLISTYVDVDWKRKALLWLAYCIAWVLMARVQMLETSHNHYFWWVPLWFICTVALVSNWKIKQEE